MPPLLQLQKLLGKGDVGWKKSVFADQITSLWKKWVWGPPIAWATSYCLLPDTFWLRASKNAFKVGSVKFANSLSPPSTVKKVHTGSKMQPRPRDLSDARQKSRELTTLPESSNSHACSVSGCQGLLSCSLFYLLSPLTFFSRSF